jgi:hypothetical protein
MLHVFSRKGCAHAKGALLKSFFNSAPRLKMGILCRCREAMCINFHSAQLLSFFTSFGEKMPVPGIFFHCLSVKKLRDGVYTRVSRFLTFLAFAPKKLHR